MFGLRLQYWEDDVVEGTMLRRALRAVGGARPPRVSIKARGKGRRGTFVAILKWRRGYCTLMGIAKSSVRGYLAGGRS